MARPLADLRGPLQVPTVSCTLLTWPSAFVRFASRQGTSYAASARMNATIKLGRWFGVPVGLHYSWFMVAGLITLSLISVFTREHTTWPAAMVWLAAIVGALLFFVCIV